MPALKAA
jgi:dynein heavy chain